MTKCILFKNEFNFFVPANEETLEFLKKQKIGTAFKCEISVYRNYQFHKKMFALFEFCFEFWDAEKTRKKFMCEEAQFKEFRNELTILAGYYDEVSDLKGNLKLVAKSLAFDKMKQKEFEECYSAIVDVAIRTIFVGNISREIENQLLSFI